ncbi:hypothetical protein DFH07DRAFT_946779 [Mycena maculata]|uniref:Uncharacterized protein n=1 Tax=Mycena maculata TaxID=230809 RepID=A0AAD7HJD3_9AGAR|nr:hypothetical protein DFH07DRAFT_946779 [Mycena maculata]
MAYNPEIMVQLWTYRDWASKRNLGDGSSERRRIDRTENVLDPNPSWPKGWRGVREKRNRAVEIWPDPGRTDHFEGLLTAMLRVYWISPYESIKPYLRNDGLIGSYGITDRDPNRGDINFLSTPHLPSPFLHHFFLDPRLWGLVRIPQRWPSIWRDTGWQLTGLSLVTHAGKVIVQNHAISVLLIVGFFGGDVSNLEWSWASSLVLSSRTLIHPATPISRFPVDCKHVFCPFLYLISTP